MGPHLSTELIGRNKRHVAKRLVEMAFELGEQLQSIVLQDFDQDRNPDLLGGGARIFSFVRISPWKADGKSPQFRTQYSGSHGRHQARVYSPG